MAHAYHVQIKIVKNVLLLQMFVIFVKMDSTETNDYKCQPCMSNCQICKNKDECEICMDEYCYDTDYSSPYYHKCMLCIEPDCEVENCTKCNANFELNENNQCAKIKKRKKKIVTW